MKKLVAVYILDHENPVAPVGVLGGSAAGFELGSQRFERRDRGLARLGLDVQEMNLSLCLPSPATVLRIGWRTPAIDLGDARPASSSYTPTRP